MDGTIKMDYINVPVLLNVYVTKGLAVKAGIQPGFKVNSKVKVSASGASAEVDLEKAFKAKRLSRNLDVSISEEIYNKLRSEVQNG